MGAGDFEFAQHNPDSGNRTKPPCQKSLTSSTMIARSKQTLQVGGKIAEEEGQD